VVARLLWALDIAAAAVCVCADYAGKQPHVTVVEKRQARGDHIALGERVPFIIVDNGEESVSDRAEDPMFYLRNELAYDVDYYLEKQLRGPLSRIMEPIIGEVATAALFAGDHVRSITIQKRLPTAKKARVGTLLGFVFKKSRCVECRVILEKNEENDGGGLCQDCNTRRASIISAARNEAAKIEAMVAESTARCLECQGDAGAVELCAAGDCPHFYVRHERQILKERHRERYAKLIEW